MKESLGLIALILFVAGITLVLSYQVNAHDDNYPNGTMSSPLKK
jgi:hypothetical protein